MAGQHDDTVILPPAPRPPTGPLRRGKRPAWLVAGLLCLFVGLGGGALWLLRPAPPAPPTIAPAPAIPSPPVLPLEPIPLATEAAIREQSPAVRTVMRLAANPAVVVLDFPTLSEQARMLNRVAAWAEKGGVPHDRLLSEAELDAAIRAGGTTAETYYYGHDYRGSDLLAFFALADRDAVPLRPDEQELRRLLRRAAAEPAGLGAVITVVRADAANDVSPQTRATILHHELAHGEYFTNPAYAAFVDTVWRGVLSAEERAAFRTWLGSEGYDPALEDLMRNEMQAYLMHTPDPMFFDPKRLGFTPARLAQIRAAFVAGMPAGWLRDSVAPGSPEPAALLPASRQPAALLPASRPAASRPRRQRAGRVSTVTTVADTVPPRRRRPSMAACRFAR